MIIILYTVFTSNSRNAVYGAVMVLVALATAWRHRRLRGIRLVVSTIVGTVSM